MKTALIVKSFCFETAHSLPGHRDKYARFAAQKSFPAFEIRPVKPFIALRRPADYN